MKEFIRGWKGKIGMLTLLMACMAMGGWIRSRHFDDFVEYRISTQHWFFTRSNDSRFTLEIFKESRPGRLTAFRVVDPFVLEERYDRRYGEYQAEYDVPYWSVVAPLTLISAFLLLSNPRKSNQKKITDLVAKEGATL